MDILVYVTVGIIVFLVARNFMDFEKENLPNSQKSNENAFFNQQKEPQVQNNIDYETLQLETGIVVALMAKLSTADGKICELEREFIDNSMKDFAEPFPNPVEIYNILHIIFEKESEKSENTTKLANDYYEFTRYAYTKRIKVLQHIINLAYIDKTFSQSEEEVFQEISNGFQVNEADYNQLLESFKKFYQEKMPQVSDPEKAMEILEVTKENSIAEIKKAYRAMVRKFHPDVLKGQGFNDEVIEENTKKLQLINEAYEVLKKYKA